MNGLAVNGNGSDAHAREVAAVLEGLRASAEGLSAEEAALRLSSYGPNELPREKNPPAILLFFKQFNNSLFYILFAAALVSLLVGHAFDALAIGIIVAVNGLIGFFQEQKAEQSLKKL